MVIYFYNMLRRTAARTNSVKLQLVKGAKDDLPSSQTPGVVYALGCTECERVYIGETGRTAEQRVKEHNAHVKHDRWEQSAMAKHVLKKITGCTGNHTS